MLVNFNRQNFKDKLKPLLCPICSRPMSSFEDAADEADGFLDRTCYCKYCDDLWSKEKGASVDIYFYERPDDILLYKLVLYIFPFKIEFTGDSDFMHTDFWISSKDKNGPEYIHCLEVEEDIEFDASNTTKLLEQIAIYTTFG